MKIGVLTLPLNINYGGILQAYALQTVLERMGHQVSVFNKHKEYPLPRKRFLVYLKRFVWRYILRRKNYHVFEEQYQNKVYPVVARNMLAFVETYIHADYTDLSHLNNKDFEALVVGSDQIWRPQYYKPIDNAYLAFASDWDVRRIAYAASFGTDLWDYSPKQEARCGELIKKFEAVSVREMEAVEMVREHFGVKAEHVVDPTLLLEKEDYIHLIEQENTHKSTGDMLVYVLDETEEKQAFIDKIAKKKG
ncbi:polysaccharide pyruvyl transferase family protein [Prevotella dentasini]|uniref:polysaccharide pyruvyl transferase family protein n=1 Tax=Prevotella dentasini TaxID=589537 RepID=UPI000A43F9DA|nr:polysaccharide pyruvyl transferase family protein [Prevotella dentasini]